LIGKIKLILIFQFLIIGCAPNIVNNNQLNIGIGSVKVNVTGVGSTLEEAKKDANILAIQQVYGSLVIANRKVVGNKLFEEDISYSSGIIENTNYLSQIINDKTKLYEINADITVSHSRIEKKLSSSIPSNSNFDGNSVANKIIDSQIRADSQTQRYLRSQALFEYLLKQAPSSIVENINLGKLSVNSAAYSKEIKLDIDILANEKIFNDILEISKINVNNHEIEHVKAAYPWVWEDTMVSFTGLHWADISSPAGKSLKEVDKQISLMGICLRLIDENKKQLLSRYIHNGLVTKVKHIYSLTANGGGTNNLHWEICKDCNSQYFFDSHSGINYGNGNMTHRFRDVIYIQKNKRITFDLSDIELDTFKKVNKFTAIFTSKNNCNN